MIGEIKMPNLHIFFRVPREAGVKILKFVDSCGLPVVPALGVEGDIRFIGFYDDLVILRVGNLVKADGKVEVSITGNIREAFAVFKMINDMLVKEKIEIKVRVWRLG